MGAIFTRPPFSCWGLLPLRDPTKGADISTNYSSFDLLANLQLSYVTPVGETEYFHGYFDDPKNPCAYSGVLKALLFSVLHNDGLQDILRRSPLGIRNSGRQLVEWVTDEQITGHIPNIMGVLLLFSSRLSVQLKSEIASHP